MSIKDDLTSQWKECVPQECWCLLCTWY